MLLGGQAGVLRSVAPFDRTARQGFADPTLLRRIRAAVPRSAWDRTGLRVWRGAAPPLSPFGFHLQDPTGWLVLDGRSWELRGSDGTVRRGELASVALVSVVRHTVLLVRNEDGEATDELTAIPTLGIGLDPDLWIRFPAPGVAPPPPRAPREDDLHTHAAEGAALVWHLKRVLGDGGLPAALAGPPPGP